MATKTKLTVRIESEVLIAAKLYAEAHQTSLSRLISAFFHTLPQEKTSTPVLRKLTGILPAEASPEDHRVHLARMYGG